jgi:hypothetical protein
MPEGVRAMKLPDNGASMHDAANTREDERDKDIPRCQMCGDELKDDEKQVCGSCYAMEVTAGDVW